MAKNTPEILAPAGSEESLLAAVRCGTNAVYLGGKYLNARRGAANFDENGLIEAVSYCRARNVKVYLTLNTIVFDDEMNALLHAVENACAAGVDAILTQDMAAAAVIRAAAPSMPLHASTQMSIHNLEGAQKLAELGFSRVVLAREMSFNEIESVVKNSSIETEVFIHGALCMSVSGQCLLSSMIGGRSGNRGLCAQPCRLPFKSNDNDYALSLRDMSHVPHIRALQDLGVTALKIEGRLKRPEYVAAAVTAVRQSLNGEPPDMTALEAVFSRGGFTDGYFTAQRGRTMFGIRRKEDVTAAAAVIKPLSVLYKDELQSVPISIKFTMRRDEPVSLTVTDSNNTISITGAVPEPARTAPLTSEKISALLNKTGGTPYVAEKIETDIDDGLMLPSSTLNALRRDAVSQLHELRSQPRPCACDMEKAHLKYKNRAQKPAIPQEIRVRLGGAHQLYPPLLREAETVILPLGAWSDCDKDVLRTFAEKIYIEIPRVLFETSAVRETLREVKAFGITDAVAGNLGGIKLAEEFEFTIHGDYSLNIVNTAALSEYASMGLRDATLSFETSAKRIEKIQGDLPRGILAYGYLPLMALRNCPSGCANCKSPMLTDRLDKSFHLDCTYGTATLYNSVPLYLAEKLNSFKSVDFFTLYFTKETPDECLSILRCYKSRESIEGQKTNGLYFRDVL